MVWNAQNSFFSPNVGASGSYNVGASGSHNVGANGSHNVGAYGSHNVGAYGSHNVGAGGSYNVGAGGHNVGAYGSHNVASVAYFPGSAAMAIPVAAATNNTGAGSASGNGFLGGYGPVARFEYATPAGLAPLPWVMDITEGDGWPSFPHALRLNPYPDKLNADGVTRQTLEWQAADWDPGLRFWSLEFDPQLTEWLQDLNLAAPSVMAAREFARRHELWLAVDGGSALQTEFEKDLALFKWRATACDNQGTRTEAFAAISRELDGMIDLMRDDRMRYLEELSAQSGAIVPYFVHLMGINPASKPWTMELMNCASAIGNLVKMQYKSHYKRVRASVLCPGLTPPWGPPQHPSFPSGHATVAHLTALLLMMIPGVARRFGLFEEERNGTAPPQVTNIGRPPVLAGDLLNVAYGMDQHSPLLWMAWRIARGRERLGVHYASDSAAGRRLAALVWHACTRPPTRAGNPDPDPVPAIDVPSLQTVLTKARAEWPEL